MCITSAGRIRAYAILQTTPNVGALWFTIGTNARITHCGLVVVMGVAFAASIVLGYFGGIQAHGCRIG